MSHGFNRAHAIAIGAIAMAAGIAQAATFLATDAKLNEGQYVTSANGFFHVAQRDDGNLCVYKGSTPFDAGGSIWCTGVRAAKDKYFSVIQGDGNLCTYRTSGGGMWCNMRVPGPGKYFLAVQNDGQLCTYAGSGPQENYGQTWCNGVSSPVNWQPAPPIVAKLQPAGAPTIVRAATPGYNPNFPKGVPCPTATYVVPPNASYIKITAVGGAGVGGDSANLIKTLVSMAGLVSGNNVNAPGSLTSWADIKGGDGGHGAVVTAIYRAFPGQRFFIVAGMSGHTGIKSGRGVYSSGYPGGGYGYHPGGGLSMVTYNAPPSQPPNDSYICSASRDTVLVVAGGGGGSGLPNTGGSGGKGGDAGLLDRQAESGGAGGGPKSGGGGGGAGPRGPGLIGSHPGCGTSDRNDGRYMGGSNVGSYGGAGGGGYYGGGGGGNGDCFMNTGHGGGGGGSSFVLPDGLVIARSAIDADYDPRVEILPLKQVP